MKLKALRLLTLIILIHFLSSCSTDVDFKIPFNRFETPETQGTFPRGEVEFFVGDAGKVTTASVYEDLIFNTGPSVDVDASLKKASQYGGGFRMGLLPRFDFYLKSFSDSVSTMGLKFQIIGSPQEAVEKGFKLAVAAAYGNMDQNDGTLKIYKNSEERKYDTHININSFDINIIPGYRIDEKVLIYFNGYYSEYDTISKLSSNQFSDINIKGRVTSYGALAGFALSAAPTSFELKTEIGYGHVEWQNQIKLDSFVWGITGGVNW